MAANITPFIWFQDQAHDAAKFYCSIFKGSKIVRKDGMSATVRLQGRTYILFNGGEHYRLTPAFSMFITVKTQREVNYYWNKLVKGGQESRCGWLVDKYPLRLYRLWLFSIRQEPTRAGAAGVWRGPHDLSVLRLQYRRSRHSRRRADGSSLLHQALTPRVAACARRGVR
jgi:hypothetical protein